MTTEEMLAEALRLLARAENLIPSGGFAQLGALGAQWHSDYRHADNSFLAAYDQARTGQQQTGRVKCTCDLKTFGTHAPDCRPQRKPPPDAGSVGQERETGWDCGRDDCLWCGVPPGYAHAFVGNSEQCAKCGAWRPGGWANTPRTPCTKPDPQPAPKCQTCGDTGRAFWRIGELKAPRPYPCPDCSKPTGGTP